MISKELLRGTIKTIILTLLSENDRMYGYEITQLVKQKTDGELIMTEGALYPSLHKLEADGLLIAQKEYIGKRIRKYYSLTPKGIAAAEKMKKEYFGFTKTMKSLISSGKEPEYGSI